MCGILGVYNFNDEPINIDLIRQCIHLQKHRGPDNQEVFNDLKNIALAHSRLSIIDLSKENNQPFTSNCKNYTIVFNGEIYNYLELKSELIELGYSFRTKGDTEVVLNSFIEWGEKCVKKFNGDWAFVILNSKEKSFFGSRDRFGVKPLYYTIHKNHFLFSSEIKSIIKYFPDLKEPNYNVINNYARNSLGAQHHETWFNKIYRVKPANNFHFKEGSLNFNPYWSYPTSTIKIDYQTAKQEYKRLFEDSIKIRMRSDVKVGTTLSSGIDSTSIVGVLSKTKEYNFETFTCAFAEDEFGKGDLEVYRNIKNPREEDLVSELATELRFNTNFITISKNKNYLEKLSNLIYYLESGHSSPAIVPLDELMGTASKNIKVVLEGQGADEQLGGYVLNTFWIFVWSEIKKFRFLSAFNHYSSFTDNYSLTYAIKQGLRLLDSPLLERIFHKTTGIHSVFTGNFLKYTRIPPRVNNLKFSESINKSLCKAHMNGLVNLLHYGDSISMKNSIESRLPFLDYRLVEYTFQLPYKYKIRNGLGKLIHRDIAEETLPSFITKNPLKFGFITPLDSLFNSYNSKGVRFLLSERTINRQLYDKKNLIKIINKQINSKRNYLSFLYRLISIELWFRIFIDDKDDFEI